MPQKILLFTKNYPPQIGGIEKYSFDLYRSLLKDGKSVKIIKIYSRNTYLFNKSWFSFFWKQLYIISEFIRLSIFLFKSFTLGLYFGTQSDLIWGLDASLSWLIFVISRIVWVKTRITLHGTDVVWRNRLYQFFMPYFWWKIDSFVSVSYLIRNEAVNRGILAKKIIIQEHSLETLTFVNTINFDKTAFLALNKIPSNKILLFSLGRFVEIKGFHWFISKVLPFLDQRFYYILWGFWPLLTEYCNIIDREKLHNISIIGPLDEQHKAKWFCATDYFVMPNIMSGGVEGFWIVLLEAHYYKKKSIISDAHGINTRAEREDIILPTGNPEEWIKTINRIQ